MGQQAFASPEEALQHYGVKGMRWGVRKQEELVGREPAKPEVLKPLTEKQQAKVDKFMKRSDVLQTRISELQVESKAREGTKNPWKAYEKANLDSLIKQTEKQRQIKIKDAEAVKRGKMTRKQKQVVAGAVVVTAIVGAGFVINAQQSGAINSWKLMGQQRLTGGKTPFTVNKNLARKMSAKELLDEIAKPVNPGYSKAGGKMNCRRSTYAYELRRRGFDVHATTSSVGWGQSESGVINALTTEGKDIFKPTSMSDVVVKTGFSSVADGDTRKAPGAKILLDGLRRDRISADEALSKLRGGMTGREILDRAQSNSKAVLDELAKQPNGARGEVLFKFDSFGHSMAYEIVDGVPKIFDSQKGTMYDISKRVESKWDGFSAAEIRRLDNMDLDLNFLTRWATNVKGK